MAKRISSAFIIASFTIIAIFFGSVTPIVLDICLAVICGWSTFEIFTAVNIKRSFHLVIPSVLFSVGLPLTIATPYCWMVWYVFTVVFFSIMIVKKDSFKFKDVVVIYGMTMIVTISLSTISLLNKINSVIGCFFVVLAISIAWLADCGALLIGRKFGKHKLVPKISPKKTVEGAIGGFIFSVIGSIIICLLFDKCILVPFIHINYICVIVLALVGSLLSILGDLSFSYLKRACNIKDFGNVIPGHGGILDRFDSVVFVAPFIYCVSLLSIEIATYVG